MLFHRNTPTDAKLPTSYPEISVQHSRHGTVRSAKEDFYSRKKKFL